MLYRRATGKSLGGMTIRRRIKFKNDTMDICRKHIRDTGKSTLGHMLKENIRLCSTEMTLIS